MFFIGGVAWAAAGSAAPWYVLAAVALGVAVRAMDIEARALFVPGGLYGSVRDALGPLPAKIAASALLVERLMLGPLAAVVAGHYLAAIVRAVFGSGAGARSLTGDDGPVAMAIALLGAVWWLQRQGRTVPDRPLSRAVGASIAMLVVVAGWGLATAWLSDAPLPAFHVPAIAWPWAGAEAGPPTWLRPLVAFVALGAGLGVALPAVGGVDVLGQVALDLEQPRIRNLQRVARLVGAFGLLVSGALAFVLVARVPDADRLAWVNAPLAAITLSLGGPGWARAIALVAVVGAAFVFLAAAARSAAAGVHGVLSRLVDEGILDAGLRTLHPRFGTPSRLIDATAVAQIGIVLRVGRRGDAGSRAPTPSASSGARC